MAKRIDKLNWLPIGIVAIVALVAVLIVVGNYGDLVGARLIKKSSTKISVSQGEHITLQISPLTSARKLELCPLRKSAKSSKGTCVALVNVVPANQTKVNVVIPQNFIAGPAFVQSRVRIKNGGLQAGLSPIDEKISLLITNTVGQGPS